MSDHPTQPTPIPMIGDMPAWYEILRRYGYPTTVEVLDFETYFDNDYSLRKRDMSTIEYIMDPRYEELGVASLRMSAPFASPVPHFWFADGYNYIEGLKKLHGPELADITVVMQNARFDATILARKYGIYPRYCIDTLALAMHDNSRTRNGLEHLAERCGLPDKGETEQFKALHLRDQWVYTAGRPPQRTPGMEESARKSLRIYAENDAKLEWEIFARYLPRLSNPKIELRLIQHTLELFTKPVIRVRPEAASSLSAKMEAEIDGVVLVTGHTREELSGNKTFSAILSTALDEAGDSLSRYQKCGKPKKDGTPVKLLALAKDDEQLKALHGHHSLRVREITAARTAIKSWPLHLSRVARITAQAAAIGGVLCNPLKYHGAHTGRWSGGEQINLQNLGARGHDLVTQIRHLLEAPDGYSFVIVDAAQIEARVLTWIAGQADWNEMWKDPCRDAYCEFASKMSGKIVVKIGENCSLPEPVQRLHKRLRGMGKVGTLGCGYGMGADKAVVYAATAYGVYMTPSEAAMLVKTYRLSVPKVTQFWREVEQKFKAAAKYREVSVMPRGLKFWFNEELDCTTITLPSGRELRYHGVRVSLIDGREQLWMPDSLCSGARIAMWGGYLCENIVQAISRDILAESVLASEDAGNHVVHHVHDELVPCVLTKKASFVLKQTIARLSKPPAWGLDLPLASEGKISPRYEK